MTITFFKKEKLFPEVQKKISKIEVVLDIGCGIMPQQLIRPLVHICCDPFSQYIEYLKNKVKNEFDRQYVIINADWKEVVEKIPDKTIDSVFLIDVVEHLEKEEGLRLLNMTGRIARKQIVIFTPLGFLPQEHVDGKDAWGLDGGAWQEHKSSWLPEDFDESWDIYASEDYHQYDNMGKLFEKPFGAFWAIKNISPIEWEDNYRTDNPIVYFKDAADCLVSLDVEKDWEELVSQIILKYQIINKIYHQLKDEHHQLKAEHHILEHTRAVRLARIIEEYPSLKRLISVFYDSLDKAYSHIKKNKDQSNLLSI